MLHAFFFFGNLVPQVDTQIADADGPANHDPAMTDVRNMVPSQRQNVGPALPA